MGTSRSVLFCVSTVAELRAVQATVSLPQPYWRILAVLMVFNLVNFPDALLLLRAHELGLSTAGVVGVYAVYNLAYAALSYPAGALSDRLSRPLVFAAGLVFFAVGYLGLGLIHAPWLVFLVLPLYVWIRHLHRGGRQSLDLHPRSRPPAGHGPGPLPGRHRRLPGAPTGTYRL
ncbi:MFS transporter [Streptomyces mirabilis]|uniref:MFS transporter n=1 Tax=Streptomyces mirabilis TaxID=68239 RepID=UPI002252B144|nr:MFS transporter [Streptomyces mirabilis]MCX4430722.1 hypothetical protein [Streptomyces mirabilis]